MVYQAYPPAIADAAVAHQRFVAPFSFERMTWIKPSFLWMMDRSNWGRKVGQERILAVRITRAGWDDALARAVLTAPEPRIHGSPDSWRKAFDEAVVRVQWDPERSIRGGKLEFRSIQVGLSRHVIRAYAQEWVRAITDVSALVARSVGSATRATTLAPNVCYRVSAPIHWLRTQPAAWDASRPETRQPPSSAAARLRLSAPYRRVKP